MNKKNENRTSAGGVDDGPRFMYGNFKTYEKYVRKMADKLGMSIEDWLIDIEQDFNIGDSRDVVDTVSYFPTGDAGSVNVGTDYHPEISSDEAYRLWSARAEKLATIANNVKVVDDIGGKESKNEPESEKISEEYLFASKSLNEELNEDNEDENINNDSNDFNENNELFIPIDGGYRRYILDHIHDVGLVEIVKIWRLELQDIYRGIYEDQLVEIIDTNMYHILGEKTYKDLRRDAPNFLRIRAKSRNTPGSRFISMDENDVITFETPSHTIPGVDYNQYVKLLDLDKLLRMYVGRKSDMEIVRMALAGDIEVHCTDPSWKYWGFQYIGTKDKYSLQPEPRFPKVRNPYLKGSVCKHLDNVLYILPFQSTRIISFLKQQNRL